VPYPHLFQPIRVGSRQARNRIMRLATTTNTGANGGPGARTVAFYRSLAQGGTGIIVSEAMHVHGSNTGRNDLAMQLYRKEIIPALAQVAAAAHDAGALFIVQANHGGRQHHGSEIPANLMGPSPLACPYSGGVPHEMTQAEIKALIAGFIAAAQHARQAGCDGIEIHGGQGHLLQQFISPYSNRRDDEYGGSLENRLRLVIEIISGIRDQTGADFVIGLRLGIDEFTPGGITIEDSVQATVRLRRLDAIDYFSLTQANFNTLETHCPDAHHGPAPYIALQARIKAVAGPIPVVASTRIQTPEQADAIIAAGHADIIGMARALIADPEWPKKAMADRGDEIRRCISTSTCWTGGVPRTLSCSINPTVGRELELPPLTKSEVSRRVVVVGGGPAGLEAARIAAERGHQVVLFERSRDLGGKLAGSRCFAPSYDLSYVIDYLEKINRKLGVDLRPGVTADVPTTLAERPDAVIVATGATILAPPLAGDDSVAVYGFGADIPHDLPPGKVVVVDQDGYFWPAAVTETLARMGRTVSYVTRFFEPLREVPKVSRISCLRAFDELGVDIHDNMTVECAQHGALVLRHAYNRKRSLRIEAVGALVWVGVQRPNAELARQLRDAGVGEVRVIGDAHAPRRLASAIGEGHRAGRAVCAAPSAEKAGT
jgi:2,4-dienoyl-CoA reductase-like NADH-dependent reductase (Old Yellow Enzyme family)/thioredoxin reductase